MTSPGEPDITTCPTYGLWWIRQFIGRAHADKTRSIRLPLHGIERLREIARPVASLDTPIGGAGGTKFGELIEDADIVPAIDVVEFRATCRC